MSSENNNIILDIHNLYSGYGDEPIIKDFNLQLFKCETVAITGHNGCGKSTLLKSIYQLCIVNSGDIIYNGVSLLNQTPEQIKMRGIAFFMQKNAFFAQLKVKENIALSLNGLDKKTKEHRIAEILEQYPQFKIWMNKTAGLLSGGQRQQLAMAMLQAQKADLWLLDEPTAGLDKEKTDLFIQKIQSIKQQRDITILFVEHKTEVVNKLATRIIKF